MGGARRKVAALALGYFHYRMWVCPKVCKRNIRGLCDGRRTRTGNQTDVWCWYWRFAKSRNLLLSGRRKIPSRSCSARTLPTKRLADDNDVGDNATSMYHERIELFSGFSQNFSIQTRSMDNNDITDAPPMLSIAIACHSHAPLEE